MRLLLMGGPGSGKGTQAVVLKEAYNIAHISTGDILRAECKEGTELGKLAKSYMEKGDLVPDGVIIDMVKNRVAMPDCEKGYILDGFPRSLAQAEAMDAAGIEIDLAILLNVPDEVMKERMLGRAAREGRADDANPDTIARRIKTFHEQTDPVSGFYGNKGLLVEIDGVAAIEDTTKAVHAAIKASGI